MTPVAKLLYVQVQSAPRVGINLEHILVCG